MSFTDYSILPLGLLLLFLSMSFKSIPQSEEWTVERFGRFVRVLRPGLQFVFPFINRIGVKISMRERVLDVEKQDIITRDNAIVTVDGVVFYQIFDSGKAAYKIANMENAITQLTMTNIRTVMGEMELDNMLSNRETINAKLLMVIDEATDPWGVKVTRIEIKDIIPPPDLQASMARQIKAEREKRATILEAEGLRQSQILKAEGEKRSSILSAEGKNEALILEAKAQKQEAFLQAEARQREAEAEAEAVKVVTKAMSGKSLASDYFISQKYIESLKEMATAKNSKTIFMPFEGTKLMGLLGGAAALTKKAWETDEKQ